MKLHRMHNTDKELVQGGIEIHLARPTENVGAKEAGGSDKEAKSDGCRTMDSNMDTKLDEILIIVKS